MDGKRFDTRAIVMIVVAVAWLAYVGSELIRDRPPEIWTWGILTGVYAALYQPWAGRGAAQGRPPGQNEVSGPAAPKTSAPKRLAPETEDET